MYILILYKVYWIFYQLYFIKGYSENGRLIITLKLYNENF